MEDNLEEQNRNNCQNEDTREEMISRIKALNFTVIELALYLDTHPEDKRAVYMHREYCKQLRDLKDKYQKIYGPLSIYYPCNKWRWVEEPWASLKLGVEYLILQHCKDITFV